MANAAPPGAAAPGAVYDSLRAGPIAMTYDPISILFHPGPAVMLVVALLLPRDGAPSRRIV
jgi:hypothetical protein